MASIQRMSIEQAHRFIEEQQPIVLDVRDVGAYQTSSIAGAVHLDNHSVQAFLAQTARDSALLVYCYHGNSSMSAAQFLAEQGFDTVVSLEGGFEAWRQVHPVE